MKLVEVYYRGGKEDSRYKYWFNGDVRVGDLVLVPLGTREKHAIVTNVIELKENIKVVELGD